MALIKMYDALKMLCSVSQQEHIPWKWLHTQYYSYNAEHAFIFGTFMFKAADLDWQGLKAEVNITILFLHVIASHFNFSQLFIKVGPYFSVRYN